MMTLPATRRLWLPLSASDRSWMILRTAIALAASEGSTLALIQGRWSLSAILSNPGELQNLVTLRDLLLEEAFEVWRQFLVPTADQLAREPALEIYPTDGCPIDEAIRLSDHSDMILLSREQARRRSYLLLGRPAWQRVLAKNRTCLLLGTAAERPAELLLAVGGDIGNEAAVVRAACLARRWQCSIGLMHMANPPAANTIASRAADCLSVLDIEARSVGPWTPLHPLLAMPDRYIFLSPVLLEASAAQLDFIRLLMLDSRLSVVFCPPERA